MSDTAASLRRKIRSACDLQSVVRTMKAMAASSIGQYEQSVHALGDYYRAVELGLGACIRNGEPSSAVPEWDRPTAADATRAVVFRRRLRFRSAQPVGLHPMGDVTSFV